VLVRGGGSNTDLSAFDAYETVLATGLCPIPVFTGIGHERNVSLADLMAAQSHKTPTKAAAAILAHNMHYISGVVQNYKNIQRVAARKLERLRLETISKWNGVLQQAQWKLNRQKQWVEHTLRLIRQMDPSRLLQQGYALVYHKGKRVDHASKLEPGNEITLFLKGGRVNANISEIKTDGTE
jgi:exodeoxyribonuclease VII large subunit